MSYLLLICCIVAVASSSVFPTLLTPYNQLDVLRYTFASQQVAEWPQLPVTSVQSAAPYYGSESFIVLGDGDSLLLLSEGQEKTKLLAQLDEGLPCLRVATDSQNNVYVGCTGGYHYFPNSSNFKIDSFSPFPERTLIVNDMAVDEATGVVFLATSAGLWVGDASGKLGQITFTTTNNNTDNVRSVALSPLGGSVAIGTDWSLWRTVRLSEWHFFRAPGIVDGAPNSLWFDAQARLWIANNRCLNVQDGDFVLSRVDGLTMEGFAGGLPVNELLSVTGDGGSNIWFGSAKGAVRLELSGSIWHFYSGSRYLPVLNAYGPTQAVTQVVSNGGRTLAIVPGGGVSLFRLMRNYTLEEKADKLDECMVRHRYTQPTNGTLPNGGYLAGDSQFSAFGDPRTSTPQSNDNNGLWTAIYVVGQTFRYQVEKDPAVKANAWKYLLGLAFLNDVTGIPGLPARSVRFSQSNPGPGNPKQWQKSPKYPGWWWESDTSSDEITGHQFAYPVAYDLLAETEEEKALVSQLQVNQISYIVKNGFRLIDWTVAPTTWGHWEPAFLNGNWSWYDNRGVNSLQILSYLSAGYGLSGGDLLYLAAWNNLTSLFGYDDNIINVKITQPDDDNYSDDELTYLPYFTFIWSQFFSSDRPRLPVTASFLNKFRLSMQRTWNVVRTYNPSLWAAITCLFDPNNGVVTAQDQEAAVNTLRQWPLDSIDWPVNNTVRQDLVASSYGGRMQTNIEVVSPLVPPDERDFVRWNSDPFDIKASGSGRSEADTGAYSCAYWMMRWLVMAGGTTEGAKIV